MLSLGIASYNLRAKAPSEVPVHNQIIGAENLKSQQQLSDNIIWTGKMKIKSYEKNTN